MSSAKKLRAEQRKAEIRRAAGRLGCELPTDQYERHAFYQYVGQLMRDQGHSLEGAIALAAMAWVALDMATKLHGDDIEMGAALAALGAMHVCKHGLYPDRCEACGAEPMNASVQR